MVVTRQYMEEKILTVHTDRQMVGIVKSWSAEKIYDVYTRMLNAKKFEKEN